MIVAAHPDDEVLGAGGLIAMLAASGVRLRLVAVTDGEGSGPHPHVHGANLGFSAAAYLKAGGFPDVPAGEDHALVAAMTVAGGRVLRTRSLPVVTSARREARAPHGFSRYLTELSSAS